jgi:serine/threonine protein kinase
LTSKSLVRLLQRLGCSSQSAEENVEAFAASANIEFGSRLSTEEKKRILKARLLAPSSTGSLHARGPVKDVHGEAVSKVAGLSEASKLIRMENPRNYYTFSGELGRGGFGTVFLGRRKTDKHVVAIKEGNEPLSKCRQEVLEEIQVMKMCNHKNIVHMLEAFADKVRFVFVLFFGCFMIQHNRIVFIW